MTDPIPPFQIGDRVRFKLLHAEAEGVGMVTEVVGCIGTWRFGVVVPDVPGIFNVFPGCGDEIRLEVKP